MSSKLPWFKHWRTTHTGSSFRKLRAERDFETMACYWLLLELLAFHEDQDAPGKMEIPHSELHQTWNLNSQRCAKVCTKLLLNFSHTIFIEKTDKTYKVFIANWLEYQENRGKKKQNKIDENPGEERREKREERIENKEVRKKNEDPDPEVPEQGLLLGEEIKTGKPVFDFEAAYNFYPRKSAKAKGMANISSQVTSQEKFDDFLKAVKNYAEDCRLNETEESYIKNFTTFVGSKKVPVWRDYINYVPRALSRNQSKKTNTPRPASERDEDLDERFK